VHQDDYHSDTEHVVQKGGVDVPLTNIQGGEATIIEGNLQELIRKRRKLQLLMSIARGNRRMRQCCNTVVTMPTITTMTCVQMTKMKITSLNICFSKPYMSPHKDDMLQ
jgi:hypothetical protein